MSTIPQRLREFSRGVMENVPADNPLRIVNARAVAEFANSIAAELESAPAADAVPVVAYIQHHKAGDNLVWDHPGGTASALVWESAHRLTVAALQARITSLEADLQFRREFQNGAEALAGKYLTQRDDARDRIASLAGENFALAAGQCIVPGGLCGDESGNQYCSLQARINALEARQKWTAVADGLPPKNTEVLICFEGQNTLVSTGQWTGSIHDVGGWCYPWENRGATDDGEDPVVTHWMDAPELPQADTSKEQP